MENCKINQNIIHRFINKKHIVPVVLTMFAVVLVFCQKTFSDSISVTPKSLFIEVQSSGTATVEFLNDQKIPLGNIPVTARSSKESVVAVVPDMGLTNSNGQVSFTITGISNGTATITFNTNILSKSLPVSVVSNIAPCAIADSSGGGVDEFAPEMMNDGIEKTDCSYHWIRTRKEVGQKRLGWIRLDWDEYVTVTRMIIQTTDCNESCGDDSSDALYIDPGRNLGNGMVQYLDKDEITWITDGEFIEEIGDVEYSFAEPITTKAIRIKKIAPSKDCKGQQSNPVVFEWKVYGTPSCNHTQRVRK